MCVGVSVVSVCVCVCVSVCLVCICLLDGCECVSYVCEVSVRSYENSGGSMKLFVDP